VFQETADDGSDKGPRSVGGDAALPPPGQVRWTPWRKRSIVLALRDGTIAALEAYERYDLSREELAAWIEGFERHGLAGLHLKCGRWRR
jgi:hypothetical protein